MTSNPFATQTLPDRYDELAPDGSEIRWLLRMGSASMVHCRLPAGQVSRAVCHQGVEELWYCLSGEGEVWRKNGDEEAVTPVRAGTCLAMLRGVPFQFRNTGREALCFVIATMPPWPGGDEDPEVEGKWAGSRSKMEADQKI